MKKILCFGDSNTFGFIPGNGERYDKDTRWTGILSSLLGESYQVIEDGRNNRNGFCDSIDGTECTGYKILPEHLKKYSPDTVVLAIGINDIQKFYRPDSEDIKNGLDNMVKTVKSVCSDIIIVEPPVLSNDVLKGDFSFQFDEISINFSKQLPEIYKTISDKYGCKYIETNNFTSPSPKDGLHYSEESHAIIAKLVSEKI